MADELDIVEINGKKFVIEHLYVNGKDNPPFYGCGILPLRRLREDLIGDMTRAQGPEWRLPKTKN